MKVLYYVAAIGLMCAFWGCSNNTKSSSSKMEADKAVLVSTSKAEDGQPCCCPSGTLASTTKADGAQPCCPAGTVTNGTKAEGGKPCCSSGGCCPATGAVASVTKPAQCTLTDEQFAERAKQIKSLMTHAVGKKKIDGGIALVFDKSPEVEAMIATLSQQKCCELVSFKTQPATKDGKITLHVTGPAECQACINGLFSF